ncbi:MAG: hypothetical protein ACTHZ9_11965 [Leucobacter sp.]|uniref:hypothetical protein n=1 Tax=Agrococcus casei TaxID=343512 RepID=UPI003F8F8801
MSDEPPLALVFMPPLVDLLRASERAKGTPLSEDEVIQLRDSATCVALQQSAADAMAEQRGYADIDPEHCWSEWQRVSGQ